MASRNKWNKMVNSYVYGGHSLKEKKQKFKRLMFYNASMRRENNKIEEYDE